MALNKHRRRDFLKSLLGFGFLSLLPFKTQALSSLQECLTTPDIEGPFYIPNAPNISILTPPEITSNLLFITGTVYANDCITPISNATVDIWHANQGTYDIETNSYLNSSYEDDTYRAKIYTDANGNYACQTILPGKYLNGSYYRPSHIHYKSSYLEQNELTTQLYFDGDSSIDIDPWASNPSAENRIISLATDNNNNLNGVFDITLNIDPSQINQTSIQEEKIIKSIYPNPINENTYIYLNDKVGQKTIEICDINGKKITTTTTLNKKMKLYDIWPNNLTRGIYIIKATTNNGIIEAKRICF